MTRMTGPDCAVMCNLINTHTHTNTQDGDGRGDGNESSSGDTAQYCRRDVGNGGELGVKNGDREGSVQ